MSTSENQALIERLADELWTKRNLGIVDELLAPDWQDHDAMPGMPPGRDGLKALASTLQRAFADTESSIDQQLTESDKVVWQWTFRGTHQGEFMGIPATGKRVALTGITIDRIADSKLVERWSVTDTLGFLQQLGAIPAPGSAA